MKYESPTPSGLEVMAKVKVFQIVGQTSRSRSQGQIWYGTTLKVLSQGLHI